MYFNLGAALIAASVVSAQTSTECNPLKTTCSPNPAIGEAGVSCDFVAHGACDAFNDMKSTGFIYDSRGGVAQMTAPGQWPTLRSNGYIFYGRVDVVMQAGAGAGIVTALVLQSDDLDEIDFEMVGVNDAEVQSNYFSKGDDSSFDRGGFHPVDRPLSAVHTYSFDWTPDRIEWLVDDVVVRTLRRGADVADDKFPQSPAQIKLGAWVAGFEGQRPGTIAWAGGKADFSSGPKTAIYKSVRIVDYAGGSSATDRDVKEYVYGDRSGSDKSIQIVLGDGSSTMADNLQDSLPSSPESSPHFDDVEEISTAPDLTTTAASSSETDMTSSSTLNMATNTTANATSSQTKMTPAAKISNTGPAVPRILESGASTARVAAGVVALAVGALAHLSCLV